MSNFQDTNLHSFFMRKIGQLPFIKRKTSILHIFRLEKLVGDLRHCDSYQINADSFPTLTPKSSNE